ncbi:MAG: hypothetical protein ACHQ01_01100 [Candidatus Limnocylindrales bacterium]
MLISLLEYRVVPGFDAEVAGYLHHQVIAPAPEGMITCFLGRRLGKNGREHLAASVWRDEAAMERGTDSAGIPSYLAPKASLLGDTTRSRYRVVASTGVGSEGARVLRLYRTSIAAGSMAIWERRALVPVDQLVATEGLLTAVAGLGIDGESASEAGQVPVIVLTAWSEWDLLLGATGGRLNDPLRGTELEDLEIPAIADHFELVATEPKSG